MRKIYVLFILSFFLLTACGGGGGSSSDTSALKVTLATQGTLPVGKALSGIGITLLLPTGVTPKVDDHGIVDSSAVVPSGLLLASTAGLFNVAYTPATGTDPGALSFVVYSTAPEGFGVGEFATVHLSSSAGSTSLLASGFTVASSSPRFLNGAEVTGISIKLAAEAL